MNELKEFVAWLEWMRSPEGMAFAGLIETRQEMDLALRRFKDKLKTQGE